MAVDVLIAEDEPGILESLNFIIERAGWGAFAVTDGVAVMDALRKHTTRVVVLDVMLPKRSGFDVLKQIKGDGATSRTPVLILTAKGQQQDRRTAEDLGADAFVTKPYANADVIAAISNLLNAGRG